MAHIGSKTINKGKECSMAPCCELETLGWANDPTSRRLLHNLTGHPDSVPVAVYLGDILKIMHF